MNNTGSSVSFDEVRLRELEEIAKRRREVGLSPDDGGDAEAGAGGNLVGLALSGGGVRSASFNLGLIQSLYDRGMLRHIDYLSTVSGGGYVGGTLSSLALHPDTEFDWKADDAGGQQSASPAADERVGRRFPLSPERDGRQSPRVMELIHGGNYLRRPLIFLNRYLVGVFLTNVVALSLVFAVIALAAWLFRTLDQTWAINWLFALGFRGDVSRAYFPAAVCFTGWLTMWGVSYWRRGSEATGHVARWFLTLTIVSLLFALAALLGTGDVSLTHLKDTYGIEPSTETLRSITGEIKMIVVVALIVALLPYLRVRDLLRSGTRPRSAVEGWIFAIASRALLYGVPLLIFGWLARENISHFNENRYAVRHGVQFSTQFDFVPLDFKDWRGTWQELELAGSDPKTAVDSQHPTDQFAVARHLWNAVDEKVVRTSCLRVNQMAEFDREVSFWKRWLLWAGYAVTRQKNAVYDQFDRREDYLALRRNVSHDLTRHVLADAQFYKVFGEDKPQLADELTSLSENERNRRLAAIRGLSLQARQVELRAASLIAAEDDSEMSFGKWQERRDELLRELDGLLLTGVTPAYQQLQQKLSRHMELADGQFAHVQQEVKQVNWNLLENYFGDRIAPKSTVFSMVCLAADQQTRWVWFMWSLGFFLVSASVVNLNATSLHGFYRNLLSKMWITDCPGMGRTIPLARLETAARGAPYHILGATVHLLGRREKTDRATTDAFMFSQSYVGSGHTGFERTEDFMGGRYDLATAIAVSGAAVSPTQLQNPLLSALLLLTNSRLGQWVPNPGHRNRLPQWVERLLEHCPPVPLRLLIGAVQKAESRNYCFVSDGGHHENLGLEALLLRRCRVIILSDVTGDSHYEFRDFVRLVRRMRFEHGIRITSLSGDTGRIPLDRVTPVASGEPQNHFLNAEGREWEEAFARMKLLAPSHYFVARIRYPERGVDGSPAEGFLICVKPNFTGDESEDLTRYRCESAVFPHDSTTDQFYDPQKFESYRQLGEHEGDALCRYLLSGAETADRRKFRLSNWSPDEEDEYPREQFEAPVKPTNRKARARKT